MSRPYLENIPVPPASDASMGFWKKLIGDQTNEVDFYEEGLEMLNAGKYHEALTSFRLALRNAPTDAAVLQQIAIAQTRIGMTDEAARTYRKVLAIDAESPGAHYGLAFLMIHEGRSDQAVKHLRSFLAKAPQGPEAERHVEHAQKTLSELEASASPSADG